ncbi:9392_t:CDS:2, partial [Paraglomus brasilianum]
MTQFENQDYEFADIIEKWFNDTINAINRRHRPCSLLLVGENHESMLNWARNLGRHIFWQGRKDLRQWDPEAYYIILDSIEWNDKKVREFKPYIKCEWQFGDCDRYKCKVAQYYGPKACIILTNHFYDPIKRIKDNILLDTIKRNVVRIIKSSEREGLHPKRIQGSLLIQLELFWEPPEEPPEEPPDEPPEEPSEEPPEEPPEVPFEVLLETEIPNLAQSPFMSVAKDRV